MEDRPVSLRQLLGGHIHPSMLPPDEGRRVFRVFDGGGETSPSLTPRLRLIIGEDD